MVFRLISDIQPIVAGVTRPKSVYSRVISCGAFIKAPATTAFGVTFPLGDRVWLKGIKVWFDPHLWAGADWIQFKVFTGTGTPKTHAEILQWQNVLPILYQGNITGWWGRYETFEPYEWQMDQLFEHKGRKFGIAAQAGPLVTPIWVTACFLVSEG